MKPNCKKKGKISNIRFWPSVILTQKYEHQDQSQNIKDMKEANCFSCHKNKSKHYHKTLYSRQEGKITTAKTFKDRKRIEGNEDGYE